MHPDDRVQYETHNLGWSIATSPCDAVALDLTAVAGQTCLPTVIPSAVVAPGEATTMGALAVNFENYSFVQTSFGAGPFFAGAAPGYGEVHVFHNLQNVLQCFKDEFTASVGADGIAKLEAFCAKMAALDGIKEYLASRPATFGMPGSKLNPS